MKPLRLIPFLLRTDRRALLILEWVLLLIFLAACMFYWHGNEDNKTTTDEKASKTHAPFIYEEEKEVLDLQPFDPNTADSTVLLRLGLAPWQVRSIYRYRAKHGRYHSPEDFRRLPGMTNEMWERLSPHIRIDKKFHLVAEVEKPVNLAPKAKEDSAVHTPGSKEAAGEKPQYPKQEKLSAGSVVNLNTADTTELKKLPGIASYRARKIVEYRNRLGGYVTTEQVMEACEMPDEILEWFIVTAPQIRKINVNTASVQQMMRHPYITFYKAKEIVEYRRKNGNFAAIDDLVRHGVLTAEEKEKLQSYLEF